MAKMIMADLRAERRAMEPFSWPSRIALSKRSMRDVNGFQMFPAGGIDDRKIVRKAMMQEHEGLAPGAGEVEVERNGAFQHFEPV